MPSLSVGGVSSGLMIWNLGNDGNKLTFTDVKGNFDVNFGKLAAKCLLESIVYRPNALIFDVDGTLADTERDGHRVAFNRAFGEAGLDWDWSVDLYGRLLSVTGGKERIQYFLDEFHRSFRRPEDLNGFIADLHRSKTRHYMAMMAEGAIPLRPGVRRLLEEG